ncbi:MULTISPECIES: DnaT-like ssDNA-binding domain-containing protein [Aliiglaciecola]|uniref:DnaT-like ssDNA-binding domain-containing protein n=1 Tax=Aliiglaciecola TaxID=1406885 RepID=UPI001C09DF1D|nr:MULTISPECIES: DnaT-like ssDNA-binding domain-containing protein [Aliiglaciecola]MBU2876504.1 flavodoxin [Aliiglaciecola lipolytica]MDO6713034.1 DnaT-like ssDNA-binding domain-containing protein [Aliiglaciecola sp. 2_MG-2023]MDO6754073.1 DnaT-like ssDNA-binding domain-containing protein [Aliiglaciecola sp. 1_MG-2023]
MNSSEQAALTQELSNDARVLYLLGLRPIADEQTGLTAPLNYKQLIALLNSKTKEFTLGRQINGLIKELVKQQLVEIESDASLDKSFNQQRVRLPLLNIKQDDYPSLHLQWSGMTATWKPHQTAFEDLASLVGIIDKDYSQHELGEFIAYWMGRPELQFSQYQWTQKFVFQIKQRRLASGVKNVQKVGNQWVTPKAGVEADDNAKQLVAKYSKK